MTQMQYSSYVSGLLKEVAMLQENAILDRKACESTLQNEQLY